MEGSWDCSPPRIVVLFIVQQPLQHPELRHQTERVTFFLSWLSTSLLLSSLRQFFVSVIFPFSLNVRPNIPVRLFYCSLGLASCFFSPSFLCLFGWSVGCCVYWFFRTLAVACVSVPLLMCVWLCVSLLVRNEPVGSWLADTHTHKLAHLYSRRDVFRCPPSAQVLQLIL